MTSSRRTRVLAMVVIGLLVLVLASRAGLLPAFAGAPDPDAPPTARQAYLEQARLHAEQQALVSRAGLWRSAAERAEEIRAGLRGAVISAPTPALAGARLRDQVLSALRDLSIRSPSATVASVSAGESEDGSPARILRMNVSFDATQHADAYAAIDLLENLPDVRTHIESVEISGPGRPQSGRVATVRLRLAALALIESGEGAS